MFVYKKIGKLTFCCYKQQKNRFSYSICMARRITLAFLGWIVTIKIT